MDSWSFIQFSGLLFGAPACEEQLHPTPQVELTRTEEARQVIDKLCDLAHRENARFLLGVGNLFHEVYLLREDLQVLIERFGSLAPTPVFLLPGPLDSYHLVSPYNQELLRASGERPWPFNVHLFTEEGLSGARIPGEDSSWVWGFVRSDRMPSLPEELSPGEEGAVHLLAAHLDPRRGDFLELAHRAAAGGFHYAALEGWNQTRLYPAGNEVRTHRAGCAGPAFGRSLRSFGERGVLVGHVEGQDADLRIAMEFHRMDPRRTHLITADLSGATSKEVILQRSREALLGEKPEHDDLVLLRLEDEIPPGIALPSAREIDEHQFHMHLDTSGLLPLYDLESYRNAEYEALTTQGKFVRRLLGRLEEVKEVEERRRLRAAIYYGLDAMHARQLTRRYED